MKVWKKLIAVVLMLSVTGCGRGPVPVPESEPEVSVETSEELIEVVVPRGIQTFANMTAEETVEDFERSPSTGAVVAERAVANEDGSVSFFLTAEGLEQTLLNFKTNMQDMLDDASGNLVDSVAVSEDYTEVIMGVSDGETFSNTFYLNGVWVLSCILQVFSHPEDSEWHLHMVFLNTNTGEIGYEGTLPYEDINVNEREFFTNSHDPYYFENVGTEDAVTAPGKVYDNLIDSGASEEDLIEVVIPADILNCAGITADILMSRLESPDFSFPYVAEEAYANSDGSITFLCTQDEIDETISNLETYIEYKTENAGSIPPEGIDINEDYSEETIEIRDIGSFEDAFRLLDVWIYSGMIQLFTDPGNDEWHLHLILINANTGETGYECTLPDEDLQINSAEFLEDT